ncbi:MAG TPA: hypothetical protein VK469_22970 [Candidatus Kapabacteria bacterium]|nr:hypothetical protein [Candidatus Kapabacteria bacterium]
MCKKKNKKINIYLVLGIVLSFFIFQINCKNKPVQTNTETVYFLVAEMVHYHGDSYILPLTNPADIAIADKIINGTSPAKIVMADIDYGTEKGEYKNKDLVNPSKRKWSWHVSKFRGFASTVTSNLNSWPTYVEEHLNQWMKNTGGKIGFATYTISRRVAISEMK